MKTNKSKLDLINATEIYPLSEKKRGAIMGSMIVVLSICFLMLAAGCTSTRPPGKNNTASPPVPPKNLSVADRDAHLSPIHLNAFLLKQWPSPSHRVNYSAEVSQALYYSGQEKLARQVVDDAWKSAKPFMGFWTSGDFSEDGEGFVSLENLAMAACVTGNTNVFKEVVAVLGDDARERFDASVLPVQKAISLAKEGKLKEAGVAMKKIWEEGRQSESEFFPRELEWGIKALHREGKKKAAQALLEPLYEHFVLFFPEKTHGLRPPRGSANTVFRVNHQEAAAEPLRVAGNISDWCRFVEIYLMVNEKEKARPLVNMALRLAKEIKISVEGQDLGLEERMDSPTGPVFYVLQEAAAGPEALAPSLPLAFPEDFFLLTGLLITAGQRDEASRLVNMVPQIILQEAAAGREHLIAPNNAYISVGLARLHHRLGNKAEAIKQLDKAAEALHSLEIAERFMLAEVAVLYGRFGELEKAKATFNESLETFSRLKKRTALLAFAGRTIVAGDIVASEEAHRGLPEAFLKKLQANDSEAMQVAVFDLALPRMGNQAYYGAQASFDYLYELVGWLSYGHYYDDGEFRVAFSKAEKDMARELVRVVTGEPSGREKQADLQKVIGIGLNSVDRKLPPWAGSIPPNAEFVMTYNPGRFTDLIREIPEESLRELIGSQADVPELVRPLLDRLTGHVINRLQGKSNNVTGLEPLLELAIKVLLSDEQEEFAKPALGLGLDILSGKLGFTDQPAGIWMDLQSPVERGDELWMPTIYGMAIPIKGGKRLALRLEEFAASQKPNINLTTLGGYKVIDSEKLLGVLEGILGEADVEQWKNAPFVFGIKDDQIMMFGMTNLKLNFDGGEAETKAPEGGIEAVKAQFKKRYGQSQPPHRLDPQLKGFLELPSALSFYVSFGSFLEFFPYEEEGISEEQFEVMKGFLKSMAFSMRFDLSTNGGLMDISLYHDKLDGAARKPLPKELARLMPNVSTAMATFSSDMGAIKKQFLENFVPLMIQLNPEIAELSPEQLMEALDQQSQSQNGFKISTLLDKTPESVLIAGPEMNQRFSGIGASVPGLLVAVKLREKGDLKELFDFLENAGVVRAGDLGVKGQLEQLGFSLIQKDGYAFLCSGEFKNAVEKGQSIGRNPRVDVAALTKRHGAAIFIDGDLMLMGAAMQRGSGGLGTEEEQMQLAMMEMIDKWFMAVDGSVKGQMTFRMGASFRPDGVGRFIKTIINQALVEFASGSSGLPGDEPTVLGLRKEKARRQLQLIP